MINTKFYKKLDQARDKYLDDMIDLYKDIIFENMDDDADYEEMINGSSAHGFPHHFYAMWERISCLQEDWKIIEAMETSARDAIINYYEMRDEA